MGEYRFGTNFVLFVYLYGGMVAWELLSGPSAGAATCSTSRPPPLSSWSLSGARRCSPSARATLPRTRRSHSPTSKPSTAVVTISMLPRWGFRAAQASVLLPDLGGTLYNSGVRIYDLGMLGDKTIARTLRRDRPAFYDYIFEEAKPTFIHVHDTWTQLGAAG